MNTVPHVAVVSSFPERGDTYPQVAAVGEALRRQFEVSWTLIGERGLFFDRLVERTLLSGDLPASFAAARCQGRDWLAVRKATARADMVIAVDFMAFACAASVSPAPVALWSLDYISDDEDRYERKINRAWLALLRRGLRRHPNVIIQDEARFGSFARSMRLTPGDLKRCLLPVALPPAPVAAPAAWTGKPHVMQIGGIGVDRCHSDFLVERFVARDGDFDLTFHGKVFDDMRAPLRRVAGRVRVSSEMVEPGEVPAIVRPASVGFIGNRQGHEQFRLMKQACGQLVEFIRCGKPVISMGPNDLGPHVETEGVGVRVATADEFDAALARIHADYEGYSRRALALFEAEYDFGRYEAGLCAWLGEIAEASRRKAGASSAATSPGLAGVERPA